MIREGDSGTLAAGATASLLADTQFSTITEAMMFVVRLVATQALDGSDASYVFRRGSDRLSQGVISVVAGGIGAAEDAEIFRGVIEPGNLYLDVTNGGDANVYHFDITAT